MERGLRFYLSKKRSGTSTRGQSLVEFAMVSVILFMLMATIMETGRLLLVYSVVSNAAQEGSHYAIIRPRDIVSSTEATAVAGHSTPVYVAQQVVPDGSCNVFAKARDKVWGLTKSDLQVSSWYDQGDGTPVPVNSDPTSPNYIEQIVKPGNRVVVETSYNFTFMTPLMGVFAPNGINVKMRSARTILSRGNAPYSCVTFSYTPAPTATITPSPTSTPTSTFTSTSTRTATVTRTPTSTTTITPTPTNTLTRTVTQTPTSTITSTSTPSPTRTPSRLIITVKPYKANGSNKPLDIKATITDDNNVVITGATVTGRATAPGQSWGTGSLVEMGGGLYEVCSVGPFSGSGVTTVVVNATYGSLSGTGSAVDSPSNPPCP